MTRFIIKAFSIVLVFFSLISCEKKTDQPIRFFDITGSWKLQNIRIKFISTRETKYDSLFLKNVYVSDGITEKNSATIQIDSSTIRSSPTYYEQSYPDRVYIYHDGKLYDTLTITGHSTASGSGGMVTYKRITADSIFFDSGSFFISGMSQTRPQSAAKLKLVDDKLQFIRTGVYSGTETENEVATHISLEDSAIYTFQRQ